MPKQKFKTFQLSTPLRGKYPPISPYKNLRLRNTSERGKGISKGEQAGGEEGRKRAKKKKKKRNDRRTSARPITGPLRKGRGADG